MFPPTIGPGQFEDIDVNVGLFAFAPGIKFAYTVLDNWQLKPCGRIGFGKDFKEGN